tara:strand:+ start:172 stop:789 length:618 start_codon:yes stop_codon:yes gene_type:complete
MESLPLFPSPVLKLYVEENTDQLNKHIEKADFIRTTAFGSNWSYTSSDVRLLKKYPRIEKILLNKFKSVAKENFYYKNDFVISTSWMSKTDPGGYSQMHMHKNSFYSGVYYFDEYDNDSSALEFENPLTAYPDFQLIPTEFNIMNSNSWKIWPQKNLLVLFPSYLRHGVLKNKSNETRYSLAFNIVPVGKYGEGDSAYDLAWMPK